MNEQVAPGHIQRRIMVVEKNMECGSKDMQSGRNTGTLSDPPGWKLGKLKSRQNQICSGISKKT